MSYEQLIKRLFSINLHGGIKLGLTNCFKLNESLDFPVNQFPAIHVAGTNGKGSVVTKIAAALEASGKKVGLYTSPHISCFRERIRINGEMISEAAIERHLIKIFSIIEAIKIPATFFEITTLLAFAYFAEEKVDVVVVETGLGGRLDATNIVNPILTIITSISLDHTEILGNTLEEITLEKAGIIKSRVPIIIGPRVDYKIIEEVAKKKDSTVISVTPPENKSFQAENESIVLAALKHLKLSEKAIEQGLQSNPVCRAETWFPEQLKAIYPDISLPKALILDVAHNPDGLNHLITSLKDRFPEATFRFVVGLSKSKDISTCLKLIAKEASHIYLIEGIGGRAASSEVLLAELQKQMFPKQNVTSIITANLALREAVEEAGKKPNEIVVVCGTFFIMSTIRAALGLIEPQDLLPIF